MWLSIVWWNSITNTNICHNVTHEYAIRVFFGRKRLQFNSFPYHTPIYLCEYLNRYLSQNNKNNNMSLRNIEHNQASCIHVPTIVIWCKAMSALVVVWWITDRLLAFSWEWSKKKEMSRRVYKSTVALQWQICHKFGSVGASTIIPKHHYYCYYFWKLKEKSSTVKVECKYAHITFSIATICNSVIHVYRYIHTHIMIVLKKGLQYWYIAVRSLNWILLSCQF